jgi:IS5 family transposase
VALPGNPYDGHTLAKVVPDMQALIANVLERIITDAGYRGHNAPPEHHARDNLDETAAASRV